MINMSNLVEWAKNELDRIGDKDDEMQQLMNSQILQIVELFASHGHSGFSASYALNIITRLLDWKPITPLTGDDSEWNEIGDNEYQNNRCYSIFKKNGQAYNVSGKSFSDDGGKTWWTRGGIDGSRVNITFPYTVPSEPERIFVEPENEES